MDEMRMYARTGKWYLHAIMWSFPFGFAGNLIDDYYLHGQQPWTGIFQISSLILVCALALKTSAFKEVMSDALADNADPSGSATMEANS